MKVRV